MAQIKLTGLRKHYGGIVAVRDLSLQIDEGELLAVLGPPGAGKTSTLKVIAGIEPATAGEVTFDGKCVTMLPPNRRNVAMVFESYALYPHLSVFENIAYPLREQGGAQRLAEAEVRKRVLAIAELLQITPTLQRQPAQLSGGQRQRVALARTLVRNPAVFLFDEPIAHLDARLRHEMRGELKRLHRERGTTTVYATPDYAEAIAMADRVAVLFGGELKQIGTPESILAAPASAEVAQFLGDPPMNILPARIVQHADRCWLQLAGAEIPAPAAVVAWAGGSSGREDVLIGARPSDVVLSRSAGPVAVVPVALYSAERLHRKTVVSLVKDKDLIKVNVPPDFAGRVDEPFWLGFQTERLLAFDPQTRLALPRI